MLSAIVYQATRGDGGDGEGRVVDGHDLGGEKEVVSGKW